MAAELGLGREQAELIGRAAPLHDIGKLGVSDAILRKPGPLSEEDFECVKRHAAIGAEILAGSSSSLLQMAQVIALTHHERWDGGGYPNGLAGEEIPLPGRIAAVADVFDALTHERPTKRRGGGRGRAEIREGFGSQFDPAVVEVFLRLDHDTLLTRMRPEPKAFQVRRVADGAALIGNGRVR